jgi:hypothetical protein
MVRSSEKRKKYMREYMQEYNRKRYANDPEYRARKRKAASKWEQKQDPIHMARLRRSALLKHRYGITPEEVDALFAKQNNKCAICYSLEPGAAWHVDHCHDKNHIRGILCQRCNMALGLFADSTAVLEAAIAYLSR